VAVVVEEMVASFVSRVVRTFDVVLTLAKRSAVEYNTQKINGKGRRVRTSLSKPLIRSRVSQSRGLFSWYTLPLEFATQDVEIDRFDNEIFEFSDCRHLEGGEEACIREDLGRVIVW
jgi:hypothetical protein